MPGHQREAAPAPPGLHLHPRLLQRKLHPHPGCCTRCTTSTRACGMQKPASPAAAGEAVSANQPTRPAKAESAGEPVKVTLRGAPMRTAKNMDASLTMPTATSVRNVPMKLVIDQRQIINEHLARTTGGKVSFTHLIAYAMVKALTMVPDMNNAYEEVDGKPTLIENKQVNLWPRHDRPTARDSSWSQHQGCRPLDFLTFWRAYEDLVQRGRTGT